MPQLPPEDWLFTRGSESIRLVREKGPNGSCRLIVYGPGTEVVTHDFIDLAECMKRQSEIEHELLAGGYHLAQLSAGRRDYGIWSGPDHRRAPN